MWRPPLIAASLVCACLPLGDSGCPQATPFVPGTYVSTGGHWENDSAQFAHAQAGAKTLTLVQLGDNSPAVRITYQRGGKTIVETWTLPAHRSVNRWRDPPCLPDTSGSLDLDLVDFGSVPLGQERPRLVTFKNRGARSVGTPVVEVKGEGFVVSANTCTPLAAAGMCVIEIRFRPRTAGPATGTLTVTASPLAAVTSKLQGLGVEPDAGADGATDAAVDGPSDAPPDAEAAADDGPGD